MKKRIILFGCGIVGKRALDFLGKENVFAFCDNAYMEETNRFGIRVIPYFALKEYLNDNILILSLNIKNQDEVINQLFFDGIDDFVLYTVYLEMEAKKVGLSDFILKLSDSQWRNRYEKLQFAKQRNAALRQLNYLKNITDIKTINKAYGRVLKKQKKLAAYATELFKDLEILGIKPFLVEGNALGLYRHDGFIPWDDDLDFGLFRKDYMKLLDYALNNFKVLKKSNSDRSIRDIEEMLHRYPNEYILTLYSHEMTIRKGSSMMDSCSVDFFSYDFYDDDYDFEEHRKKIEECRTVVYSQEKGNESIISIVKEYKYLRDESNTVYFGLDNMNSYTWKKGGWIPKNEMLPLVKTNYAGIDCYRPYNLEKYLSHRFEDYDSFPTQIMPMHENLNYIMNDYVCCTIIPTDYAQLDFLIDVYDYLILRGIYASFLLRNDYMMNRLKDAKEFLIQKGVNTIECVEPDFRYDFGIILGDNKNTGYMNLPLLQINEEYYHDQIIDFIDSLECGNRKKEMIINGVKA